VSGEFKMWKCGICGGPVIEGQRFAWLPGKGYVHVECLHRHVRTRYPDGIPSQLWALLNVSEVLSYAIVRIKQAQREAGDERITGLLVRVRREIESLETDVDREISRYI